MPYSNGRVTQIVDQATTTKFSYDQLGRTTQTQRQFLGVWHTMSQQYDALNRITSETFPDNETITYTYNDAGWLNTVSGYINGITYNARGQKTQLTYANNLTTTWTYHPTTFRNTNRTTSNNQQNLTYGYDNNGNVTSITDTLFTGSRTFGYDDLNRMTSAWGWFGPNQTEQNCTYAYNAIGNLTDKCGALLTYGDANHPSAVTNHSWLNKNYSYDANGNMLTRGNQILTWNIDNRVASIAIAGGGSSTSMEYDYAGTRVKKDAPGGITLYPFSGYEIDPNGTITKFIRIGTENFASKKKTTVGITTQYFYHNDHLGSVNVITDISGTRVQLNEYHPWGTVSRAEGTIDVDQRFTGQKLDPETGLYYYGGRYYDAEIGRFVSADPFVQTPFDPQNLNRYSYVINNPQNYIDPDGYFHQVKKKKRGFLSAFFGFIGLGNTAFTFFKMAHLDPLGFVEWKGPARLNQIKSGLETIGAGVVSLMFGNPAGILLAASGMAAIAGEQDMSGYFGLAAAVTSYFSSGVGGTGDYAGYGGMSVNQGGIIRTAGDDEGGSWGLPRTWRGTTLRFPWSGRYSLNTEGLQRRIEEAKLGIKVDDLPGLATARRGVRVYNTDSSYYQVFQRHPNLPSNQLLRITIDAAESPPRIISTGREDFRSFQRRLSDGQYLFVW